MTVIISQDIHVFIILDHLEVIKDPDPDLEDPEDPEDPEDQVDLNPEEPEEPEEPEDPEDQEDNLFNLTLFFLSLPINSSKSVFKRVSFSNKNLDVFIIKSLFSSKILLVSL